LVSKAKDSIINKALHEKGHGLLSRLT
jgi:hypothetical protein